MTCQLSILTWKINITDGVFYCLFLIQVNIQTKPMIFFYSTTSPFNSITTPSEWNTIHQVSCSCHRLFITEFLNFIFTETWHASHISCCHIGLKFHWGWVGVLLGFFFVICSTGMYFLVAWLWFLFLDTCLKSH